MVLAFPGRLARPLAGSPIAPAFAATLSHAADCGPLSLAEALKISELTLRASRPLRREEASFREARGHEVRESLGKPRRKGAEYLRLFTLRSITMKALFAVSILAIALGSLGTSFAAQSESAMLDCFNKHAQLMDKPALKNPRDCWRVHGYLSERS